MERGEKENICGDLYCFFNGRNAKTEKVTKKDISPYLKSHDYYTVQL